MRQSGENTQWQSLALGCSLSRGVEVLGVCQGTEQSHRQGLRGEEKWNELEMTRTVGLQGFYAHHCPRRSGGC